MNGRFLFVAVAIAASASPAAAIDVFEVSGQQAGSFGAAETPGLVRVQSGSRNGLAWTAASRVIGQTPTSDVLAPSNTIGGGDAIYKPSSNKSGVVALIMETSGGNFICSGSLLSGGRHIATAAHCVAGTDGLRNANRTTVHFFNGDSDQRTVAPGASHTQFVQDYFIHPDYTGEVIDQNDIAILRLTAAAPAEFERYDLHTPTTLTGAVANIAGYGTRSTVGGASGNTAPAGARTGYLREGDNLFDYAWGNDLFQGFFTTRDTEGTFAGQNFFGFAEVEYSYVSDFDNGLAAQSQSRRIANALGLGPIGDANFNDNGVGAREIGVAGGDSGGPGFINGDLATINSYGLTFGTNFGDFGGGLNSGWGEYSGYVPVYIHQDFIAQSTAIPEPASWAMLIAGFGLIGATMRRRRAVAA
jgi:hypothetical protein